MLYLGLMACRVSPLAFEWATGPSVAAKSRKKR
jgi:hypothetical protein